MTASAARPPVLRATGLGSLLGVLPGGGHVLSSFASYSVEKKLSRHPREFGHGTVEGVAGPEAANNAAAQTSFIPLLTLGIPANPVMTLVIGAFVIQDTQPGPNVTTDEPVLFWGLIASMRIGNLLLGCVLGPLLEEYLRRALLISRGDPTTFVTRPISATLLGLGLLVVVLAVTPAMQKRREKVFVQDD